MSGNTVAEVPQVLLDLVLKQKSTPNSLNSVPGEKIPQGGNDTWLVHRAGQYWREGDSIEIVVHKLEIDTARLIQDPSRPYTHRDLERIARSVARYAITERPAFVVVGGARI